MRFLYRLIKGLVVLLLLLTLALLAPVLYTDIACRAPAAEDDHQPILRAAAWQRPESRTVLTYPEWHIVYAYEDYASTIARNDPHDFDYVRAITGFWTAACPLQRQAYRMGAVTDETKATLYTIGVSFTAEMAMKALYEETVGRIVTILRGEGRAPLDNLTARQAQDYAEFLRQVPWYRYDFAADIAALEAERTPTFRDDERAAAVGLEYRVKAEYADLIAAAVEEIGADELRIRTVVSGLTEEDLAAIDGVEVRGAVVSGPEGAVVIETDRYRAYTEILERIRGAGGTLVEIAGNDEILFTALSHRSREEGALASVQRQGRNEYRHLYLVPVPALFEVIAELEARDTRLEHVYDY